MSTNPRKRSGISNILIVVSLVVVVGLAGLSLYLGSSLAGGQGQARAPHPAAITASAAASEISPAAVSSSSASSSSGGILAMSFTPEPPIISQFLSINYTLYFVALGLPTTSLNVTVTPPPGISMIIYQNTVVVPGVTPYVNLTVTMRPSADVATGLYPVTVAAAGVGRTYTQTLNVQVVKYLIVAYCGNWEPKPTTYTIPVYSSVTWLRLNTGERAGCIVDGVDIGLSDVVIPSLNVTSPNLLQYHYFTYTFTKPGAYSFYCAFHPLFMKGVITVTA